MSSGNPTDTTMRSRRQIPSPTSVHRGGNKKGGVWDDDSQPIGREPIYSFQLSSNPVIWDSYHERTYPYTALDLKDIRLVQLLPAKMSSIACEIIHVPLHYPPAYTAVSYAWGDADDKRDILVDSIPVAISANLYEALEALRDRDKTTLVWADAICINQQDRDERNKQVQCMTDIYAKAKVVSLWLGPEENQSELAMEFLKEVYGTKDNGNRIKALLSTPSLRKAVSATVALFQRDYWNRLWVVQEVFNARDIMVYCGQAKIQWQAFETASEVFKRVGNDMDVLFPAASAYVFTKHDKPLTYAQTLAYEGPGSLLNFNDLEENAPETLLQVMRACRRKFCSDPRDKVYAVLGISSADMRNELRGIQSQTAQKFPVDYRLSVKDIYTNVVDYLLHTTRRLDVICESVQFPLHTRPVSLPSWVPDWSDQPDVASLCSRERYKFDASKNTEARFKFLDRRRNELEISAVHVDTIDIHGTSVGTLCTAADYLMAFIHWRLLLLQYVVIPGLWRFEEKIHREFCTILCLGQIPERWKEEPHEWMVNCYHVFAKLLQERFPKLPLDDELRSYAGSKATIDTNPRHFLQIHFGSHMMGRCFCITQKKYLGMGPGSILPGDEIIVPLGCRTKGRDEAGTVSICWRRVSSWLYVWECDRLLEIW
ncbi:heterokaryon incompatibility protein-domain-containing protein [Xylariaceae sp. FL0255]|nr:heterokaryon incompatibility protein-domain-containing protein [Xylariaceae sp. FL0255]